MAEFTFEIEEEFGTIGENGRGWTTELNLVSFAGREAKYDLRTWAPDHARMGKGITLTMDELVALRDLLNDMDLDEEGDPREE